MNMNAQELAALLDGREYRQEITEEECAQAKAADLVVVFGASDDLVELRGAISDEQGCYEGGTLMIHDGKVYDDEECTCRAAEAERERVVRESRKVVAKWCAPGAANWTYETDIPHATFNVMEDGEVYCVGIVFALADAGN